MKPLIIYQATGTSYQYETDTYLVSATKLKTETGLGLAVECELPRGIYSAALTDLMLTVKNNRMVGHATVKYKYAEDDAISSAHIFELDLTQTRIEFR